MSHSLRQAALDCRLPEDAGVVFLTAPPPRWDEILELDLPVFISHSCGDYRQIAGGLWQAGWNTARSVRLVEASGEVRQVELNEGRLASSPRESGWTLVLNWSHPEEGWRSRLPLWGRTYVVTRQKAQGAGLVERLEDLGGSVMAVPTIEFMPPDSPGILAECLSRLEQFEWVVFTSPNGVRFFFQYLAESEKDHRALASARFACIGPGTAGALAGHGFRADLLPERFVAEGLLEALPADLSGVKVLIPRAQEAREILPDTLRERGASVLVAPVYKTVKPHPPSQFHRLAPGARVLFTSSSTVKNWLECTSELRYPCYCIGPVTARTAREAGLNVLGVAPVHTIDGLVQHLLEHDAQPA